MDHYNAVERNLKPTSFDKYYQCSICGSGKFEFVGAMRLAQTLNTDTYRAHDITSTVGLTCSDCFEPAMLDITLDEFLDVINDNPNLMSMLIRNNL